MNEYHKIQTVFKRNIQSRKKELLLGEYTLPEFEYLKNNTWVFTEKIDGTNIRIMFDGSVVRFGGKTDGAQISASLIEVLQRLFAVDLFKRKFDSPSKVCLYGEGFGNRIQKNSSKYRSDQSFILFDVNIDGWFLHRNSVEDIADHFNIDIVPIIGKGTLEDMVEMTRKGFNSLWGDFIAEGIVARPLVELKTRAGDRIITKIKYKDF